MTWTDDDYKELRRWLLDVLHTGVATVTFVKADGSIREMQCTLDMSDIPSGSVQSKDQSQQKKSKEWDHFVVWDIEKSAWRSFKLKSVRSIHISF